MKALKYNEPYRNFQLNAVSEKSSLLPPDSIYYFQENHNQLITEFNYLLPKNNPEAIINHSSGVKVPSGSNLSS